MSRLFYLAAVTLLIPVFGCDGPTTLPDGPSNGIRVSVDEKSTLILAGRVDNSPENVLELVRAFSDVAMPAAEFEPGHADPIETTELVVEPIDVGYVITFPYGSPIPTPTIVDGRMYVSGGFSS